MAMRTSQTLVRQLARDNWSSTRVNSIFSLPALPEVHVGDFGRAKSLLHRCAGIVLGPHKRDMVERTLALRTRTLRMAAVSDYLNFLQQNTEASEWQEFINAFTVNHTAFFRERHHFDVLARFAQNRERPLTIWSAACSTGEEPYSMAIRLRDTLPNPDYQVSIFASDIDTSAIATAKAGVYTLERIKPMSDDQLKNYFLRGTGTRVGMARVKPCIRSMVEFDILNLLSPSWPSDTQFDAIFCRNTMIYFDKPTQSRLLDRFARVMKPGGLLFVGHSENLTYLTDAFRLKGQTVYEVNARH